MKPTSPRVEAVIKTFFPRRRMKLGNPRMVVAFVVWLAVLALCFVLGGCVSVSYMQKQVAIERKRGDACAEKLDNEMRAADSLRQDIREGKYGKKAEPQYDIQWK